MSNTKWKVLLLVGILVGVVAKAAAQNGNSPGQGSFVLDVRTIEAEGTGCDMDSLDIQVGDIIEESLIINADPDTDCRPGSSACIYHFNWKCTDLDSEQAKPKMQTAAVMVSDDAKSARVVVPQASYPSFGGTLTSLEEYYTVSDGEIKGFERWNWTNHEGTLFCHGRDRITGTPGKRAAFVQLRGRP
jgi:hypothetical protein